MILYIPRNFIVQEFVPPSVYTVLGERSLLLMDQRILKTADQVREWFGKPFDINNWSWGGHFALRGFRPADASVGAVFSQHKYGRAIDGNVRGVPAEEARREILSNQRAFPHIHRIEGGVSWLHLDCGGVAGKPIVVI